MYQLRIISFNLLLKVFLLFSLFKKFVRFFLEQLHHFIFVLFDPSLFLLQLNQFSLVY